MSDKKSQGKGSKLPRAPRNGAKKSKPRQRQPQKGSTLVKKAQPRISKPRMRSTSSRAELHGTDFLFSVSAPATSGFRAGQVIFTVPVNPGTMGVTRLNRLAGLYERYKFRRITFRYDAVADETRSGQLIGYVDYDTADAPSGVSQSNIQRAAAHFGERPVQIAQKEGCRWDLKDLDPHTTLFVNSQGSDPRWTNQGRFVLIAASDINVGGTASLPCGNIYIDYDVEFFYPQLEEGVSGSGYKLIAETEQPTTPGDYWRVFEQSSAQAWSVEPWSGIVPEYKYYSNENIIALPSGCYLIHLKLTGAFMTSPSAAYYNCAPAFEDISITATQLLRTFQVYPVGSGEMSVGFKVQSLGANPGEYGGVTALISALPESAVSVTNRQMALVREALSKLDALSALKKRLDDGTVSESKEVKESPSRASSVMPVQAVTSGSTSSVSCGSSPSYRPMVLNEQYVLVKNKA